MKTFRMIGLMAMLCFIMPAFVSCDNDDDDPAEADAIVGTYLGSLNYTVAQYEPGNIEGTYEVQILNDPTDADDVVLVLPQCSFAPPIGEGGQSGPTFTIPSLTVHDVDVKAKGNSYTISEDSFTIPVDNKIYVGSNLTGTVNGKTISLKYQLKPAGMPMDIVFSFEGTLK